MVIDYNKSITKEDIPDVKRTNHGHGKCEAWGCNRAGHVNAGKWHCRYHWACHGEKFKEQMDHVTMILKNHEAEINWYEHLLQTTVVDYLVGVIDATMPGQPTKYVPIQMAPENMRRNEGEEFYTYRKRIEAQVNKMLHLESLPLRPPIADGKAMAAGETFSRIGNYLDEVF